MKKAKFLFFMIVFLITVFHILLLPAEAGMSINDIIAKYTEGYANGIYTYQNIGTCTGLAQNASYDYCGNRWGFNNSQWTTVATYTVNSSMPASVAKVAKPGDVITTGAGNHTAFVTSVGSGSVTYLEARSDKGIIVNMHKLFWIKLIHPLY